jgi:peroxiredoxin
MPKLKKLAKKYAEKGLVVVAPSLDAEASVKKFKKRHKIEELILLSNARPAAKAFGVRAFPTMFLVGKDGKILWKGHFENPKLHKTIEGALSAK